MFGFTFAAAKKKNMAFSLFKKKKKNDSAGSYRTLSIKEVVPIAKDAVNLVFEKPKKDFTYEPGQFLTIIDQVGEEKLRRAYSLCSTPEIDELPAVTVKRVPGGQMSNHINDQYQAGRQVDIMDPMGMFTTKYSRDKVRKAIFWGGGSGITPLYSILRTVLKTESFSKVALVYGNREEDYIIFKKELAELESEYGARFQLIHILENDPNGFTHHHGIPTPDMIAEIVAEIGFDETAEHYICGPAPMMHVVQAGLELGKVPEENIKTESFESGKSAPEPIGDTKKAVEESEVTIVLDGQEHILNVKGSTPILEAGLDAGLDMPYSCQSGLCTACRGKCLEGKVSIEEADGISQEEIDEGYALLCVGKPETDRVKVVVG